MPLLVIYNPVAGNASARALFDAHVLPLLDQHNISPDKVVPTDAPGHAGAIVADFLSALKPDGDAPLTVILGSGDGTLHDLINVLNNKPSSRALPRINLALVPCGTANALYASLFPPSPDDDPVQAKLKSVRAFLAQQRPPNPLNLAVTVISPQPVSSPQRARAEDQVSISVVVASAALHASILHDSEALRASDPTIQRFKTAALQNISRWYAASLKLFPREGAAVVEVYDPQSQSWVPHESSTDDEPVVELEGPFVYFLSTVNVDRLEPAYNITPRGKDVLLGEDGVRSAALDVIIVRPMRDPSFDMDTEESRVKFAEKAGAVLAAPYQNGAHVALRYDASGSIVPDGDGPTVVEYVRCGGWEWVPDEIDDRAHLVCADGDILTIPEGGKATCTGATPTNDRTGFALYS